MERLSKEPFTEVVLTEDILHHYTCLQNDLSLLKDLMFKGYGLWSWVCKGDFHKFNRTLDAAVQNSFIYLSIPILPFSLR